MAINTGGQLWIFCLNVGQGDTTIVLTPGNRVILIDAVKPNKILALLKELGFDEQVDKIEHIVVTHPHHDHYSGVQQLLNRCPVEAVTLSSIWRYEENVPGYNNIINTLMDKNIPLTFLSGYTQLYPDESPVRNPRALQVELLGPSRQFIEELYQTKRLNTNHYSIITRLTYGDFRMVIAADAQMESWAHFDQEQMLDDACNVLRSAHHGSANGTQYERVSRIAAGMVIVSSDPDGKDHLPDLIGSAILMRYAGESSNPLVALTNKTGTIKLEVGASPRYRRFFYQEAVETPVPLGRPQRLDNGSNPTNWRELTLGRLNPE
jgi:beta-lactamase superfamily II metal-dependent hydrolase